jgi:hypothetical protein
MYNKNGILFKLLQLKINKKTFNLCIFKKEISNRLTQIISSKIILNLNKISNHNKIKSNNIKINLSNNSPN